MANAGKSCASCGGSYGSEVLFCPLDGTPLSSSRTLAAHPHDIDPYVFLELPGQIQLNALVGIGSMGRVYRAFQAGVERDVAVKILHRELTGNLELVARFHREAKISSRLVHPNVVQVLMTGTLPPSTDARVGGEVYLIMEYLDGISLLSALAAQGEGGALPLARTLHIVLQLCDAVGEAHVNNIVHRDLKPENIMLVRRGEDPDFVKVLDFGIARLDSALEGSTTQAGLIFGTAKYISPEGAEGKHVGPQADVYAIATILYQCLAGRTPFMGDSPMALLVQQIHGTPTDLRSIPRASYVPEPIARLVMGNLSKDAHERSDNARAFGRELALAARESGLHLDSMHGGTPRGDLRLLSKQRTRQHEFSTELKAKIASIPANGAAASGSSPRPITTFEDGAELPRKGPPPAPPPPSSDPMVSSRPGQTQLGEDVPSPRAGGTQIPRESGAGYTQIPDERPDEDVTINGTLDAGPTSDELAERPRAGHTIPGSPLNASGLGPTGRASNGAGAPITASTTPTEDLVEGPISSRPGPRPSVPPAQAARASNPPARASAPPSVSPSQPGVAPLSVRPGPSQPGAPANGALSPRSSRPGLTPIPLAPLAGAPKGPPPFPIEPSEPPPKLPAKSAKKADPTLVEPVVKKPRPLSSDERDDLPPAKPVTWKTFLLIASLLVVVPALAIAGSRLLAARDDTSSFESTLEAANEAMERRDWDAPEGKNVKTLTDKLLAESPGDRRALSLRATAAERIVNDGLTKKFGGDTAEALRLFKLALELSPDLESARSLIRELEGTPAATATATSSEPLSSSPPAASAPATAKASSTAKAPMTGKPGSTSTVAPQPSATNNGDLVLPLPDLSPPPPSTGSSGPWL
ncbi:MAG: protein kinase [Polyangiaceae bacterium]|nr:protein kinase [Polyangiaceae bacterium]